MKTPIRINSTEPKTPKRRFIGRQLGLNALRKWKATKTINSVCDEVKTKSIKKQDFAAAAEVRALQHFVDPKGVKKLTPRQVKVVKSFLRILIIHTYA